MMLRCVKLTQRFINGVAVDSVAGLKKAAKAALKAACFTLIEARIDPAEYRQQR